MKRIIIATIFLMSAIWCNAQKKDSVVQITITRDDVTNLLKAIDGNIDSKKASKDIIDFILSHAILIPKEEKSKK